MVHDNIASGMSQTRKSSRAALLLGGVLAVAILVILVIAVGPTSLVFWAGRWAESQGLVVVIDGVRVRRTVGVERLSLRLASQPLPFLDARGIALQPQWSEWLHGRWVLDEARADSVIVRWDAALRDWIRSRPASKGKAAVWRIGRVRVPNWSATVLGWTVNGSADLDTLAPGSIDSALARFSSVMGIEGACAIDSGLARLTARGAGIPVAVRAIPGMDQSADTWTIDLRASIKPVSRPAGESRGVDDSPKGPGWFETLIDHRFRGHAEILAETGATGFLALDASPESGGILIDGRVGTMLSVRGTSAFSGDTLRTRVEYRASRPGEAVFEGELDLSLLPLDGMRVLEGSAFTLEQGNVRGARLPAGRVDFSGDHQKGYHLTSNGSLGSWSAELNPGKSEFSWHGELRSRRAGPVRDLVITGGAAVRMQAAGITWSARGAVGGIAEASATLIAFRAEGEGSGVGDRFGVMMRGVSLEPARGAAWRVNFADLKVAGTQAAWTASLGPASALRLHGRALPIRLEVRGGPTSIELAPLSVGGVTVRARALVSGSRYRETRIMIEETPLAALAAFLPPPQKSILDRSEMRGGLRGEFRHTSDRRLDGSLHLDVKRFHDPVSNFLVENLAAEIPIRQRFVDPEKVRFITDAERWPDVPVNLRVGTLGQGNILARDLSGRAVFADYVFRFRDITFGILGGRGRSRFMLDPFRNAQGRWRALLELKVDGAPLSNLYEEFVGRGTVARTLKGDISLDLETGWSDTECIESTGKVFAPRPGRIGHRVIAALVQMLEPAKRPPALALAVIGNYEFDELAIDLVRDADISDFRTRLLVAGEKEPFLRELKLVLPLLSLIEGLPVDVASDIGLRREP
jgi:hypothetical protein